MIPRTPTKQQEIGLMHPNISVARQDVETELPHIQELDSLGYFMQQWEQEPLSQQCGKGNQLLRLSYDLHMPSTAHVCVCSESYVRSQN